ncbi:RDD family protein [Tomitella fengzijianii]|uniref:RDD family protein n=2 Tax=Tomitella fengzijianii TaxID=2597660 RepID=A0A516X8N4_9ACTN|nr:RDD family protein [Tomitella fengzijianii]
MSGGGAPASLLPRFGARFIDGLIIAIPQQIILAIVAAAFGVSTGTLDTLGASIGYWAVTSVIAVIFAGIWVWYYVWFETHKGQTLGKQLLHLRVLGVRGGNPTLQESLRRNGYIVLGSAATVIGIIPFIGWILQFLIGIAVLVFVIVIAVSINSSPTKQGKHDEMAGGTQVVTTQ